MVENKILFQNKYKIESARLKYHDYGSDGFYFVTICTKFKIKYFGEIVNDEMILNDVGKIAESEIKNTIQIRKNVEINDWVIMPNHVHMIIEFSRVPVETHCNVSLPNTQTCIHSESTNKFAPQINNIPSVIRGFKSSVKRQCNKQKLNFDWQPRYWDRILKNENELIVVQNYIRSNPQNYQTNPLPMR